MIVLKMEKVNTFKVSRTADGICKHSKSVCYYNNDYASSEGDFFTESNIIF